MKKLKEINSVSSFKISNNKLFFDSQKQLKIFDYDFISSIAIDDDFQLREVKDSICILSDTNEPNILIYSSLRKNIRLNNTSFLHFCNKNILLYDREIKATIFYDAVANCEIGRIEERLGNKIHCFENFVVANPIFDNTKLVYYSTNTFSNLWQYDLPEGVYNWIDGSGRNTKGEIERIIGVYEGVLWLSLNSGRLLGLSVKDGFLLYNISQPNLYPQGYVFREENKYLWYGRHWQLDTEKGVLFGLTSCYYFELDLNNPNETFAFYDISPTCEQHHIKANMPVLEWSWQGDEVFFGDTDFKNQPSHVGIFNRKTRQITWTSRELGEDGIFKGINKVEYQDNRLYVLDRASTLHIFERDSPTN